MAFILGRTTKVMEKEPRYITRGILIVVFITPVLICNYFNKNYAIPKQCFFQLGVWFLFFLSLSKIDYKYLLKKMPFFPKFSIIAFSLWGLFSALCSLSPPIALAKYVYWLTGIVFVLLIVCFINTEEKKKKLFHTFLAIVNIVALGCLLQWLGLASFPMIKPGLYGSSLGNPNFVGNLIAAMGVALLAYALFSQNRFWYLLNWLFLVWVLGIAQSRGAFVGFFCGGMFFVVMMLKSSSKKTSHFLVTAILLLTVLISSLIPLQYSQKLWDKSSEKKYKHIHDRLMVWNSTWRTAKERPWLGYGGDVWLPKAYYHRTKFITEPGNEIYLKWAKKRFFSHAHNDYLEIAVEMGFPGLFLAILIFFSMFYYSYQGSKKQTFVEKCYSYAHLGACLAILTQALVSFPLQLTVGYMSFLLHWSLSFIPQNCNAEGKNTKITLQLCLFMVFFALLITCYWCMGNFI